MCCQPRIAITGDPIDIICIAATFFHRFVMLNEEVCYLFIFLKSSVTFFYTIYHLFVVNIYVFFPDFIHITVRTFPTDIKGTTECLNKLNITEQPIPENAIPF